MIEKHFVTFLSPGTMFSEESTRAVGSWDTEDAMRMAHGITERHGATPYGFYFTTRTNDGDLDSKETARSPMHFLGGEVLTLAEVEARDNGDDHILLANMRGNGYDRIIVNTNSWRGTFPFGDDAVLLEWEPVKCDH